MPELKSWGEQTGHYHALGKICPKCQWPGRPWSDCIENIVGLRLIEPDSEGKRVAFLFVECRECHDIFFFHIDGDEGFIEFLKNECPNWPK